MRRLIATLAVLATAIAAYGSGIRDIDVTVRLEASGAAHITEIWDVYPTSGTEWYINRENLGDIEVSDLKVTDENGISFINEGSWDIDRSISGKAGRCGILRKTDGVELCWGIGSYGDHLYTVSYTMTNTVKGLNDYDCFHMQLVSPGLSSAPEHVKVTICSDDVLLSPVNSRLWGFGFTGEASFSDGQVVLESSEPFSRESSVIVLLRFDKGVFSPASTQNKDFEKVLKKALKGSDYDNDDVSAINAIVAEVLSVLASLFVPIMSVLAAFSVKRREKKKMLGVKPSEIGWSREIPYGGDLLESNYFLNKLGEERHSNAIASAMILKMVYDGKLSVNKTAKEKIEISFNDSALTEDMSWSERELYRMMKEASGADIILQEKEFSRWSGRHEERIRKWTASLTNEAHSRLCKDAYITSSGYSAECQARNRELLGFKKFLSDFTLVDERSAGEVSLWREYLIFASLFGIADKVAKELRDINPAAFEKVMLYDYATFNSIIYHNNILSRAITNATYVPKSTPMTGRSGGFGGFTSFGGGGGFSGGGFGGGSR